MATKVKDFFPDEESFEELLEEADSGASRGSEAAQDFVGKMIERFEEYGLDSFITPAQVSWLKELANS